jgi:hypothetical protein
MAARDVVMRQAWVVLLILLAAIAVSGCATNADSDLPWNTPQPWEGSPTIPGMSGSGSGY